MIRNGPKGTISTNGGLELLQMVSELGTKRCASKDVVPRMRVDFETLTSIGERNETFFIIVWKPLTNRRVLKP